MYNLKIISSTVRPGRKGPKIAAWVEEVVKKDGRFNAKVLDLGQIALPMMNEPHHPVLRQYEHDHTKRWSAMIGEADAFIFVTAEYDYNYPAPLRNALEYLFHEWAYKAAGLVSYGGVSAGTRAVNGLKNDLASLRMVPIGEMVNFPMFSQFINEKGDFVPPETSHTAATKMLNELLRWTHGLKLIKENKFEN